VFRAGTSRSLFLLIALWAFPSFAEPESTAFVQWVLHSDSQMSVKAEKLRETVKENPGIFGQVIDAPLLVPMDSTMAQFEAHVARAVTSLRGKPSPHLLISLVSHGGHFAICRDGNCGTYELKEIARAIKRQLSRRFINGQATPVTIVYDACHSGTLIDVIKNELENEPQRFPFLVITSAPSERLSHGSNLVNGIESSISTLKLAERTGPILPGRTPLEKVAMLTTGFNVSIQDEPTTWSSLDRVEEWDPASLERTVHSIAVPASFSRKLASGLAEAEESSFTAFLKKTGRHFGPVTLAAYSIDSASDADRSRRILDWALIRGSIDDAGRAALIVWAESLPDSQVDKTTLRAGESRRWTEGEALAKHLDRKARVIYSTRLNQVVERPGPFKSFAAFLATIKVSSEGIGEAILTVDFCPAEELETRIRDLMASAPRTSNLPFLLGIWSETLPREWISDERIGQWEKAFRERTGREDRYYFSSRAAFHSKALMHTEDFEGLLALYATTPRDLEAGKEHPAGKIVRIRLAHFIEENKIQTPEAMRALQNIMERGYPLTIAQRDFWLSSPYAEATDKVVEIAQKYDWVDLLADKLPITPALFSALLEKELPGDLPPLPLPLCRRINEAAGDDDTAY